MSLRAFCQPLLVTACRSSSSLWRQQGHFPAVRICGSAAMHAISGSADDGSAVPPLPPFPAQPSSGPHSPATQKCRVAVAQMTSGGDRDANHTVAAGLAKAAVEQGCKMLFLPENVSLLGTAFAESLAAAEPLEGPTLQRYRQLAQATGLWISVGGFQEQGPDAAHIYNTHVVIDADGGIAASYRKIHLFDVDVAGGPILMESRFTAPGDRLVACDSPAGRLGLSVCYDLRFPEIYQRLRHDLGAHVLLVPSAFTVATGRAHWEVLLRARAIETQTYVIAAAQAGRHNAKRESYGHSLIVDPWGDVIARLDDPLATGIAVAEIDLERLADIRTSMPVGDHRHKGRAAIENDFQIL